MNNYVSLMLALLQHLGALTEAEAKKLVKELHISTLPDNYDGCVKFVKDLFDKHEVGTIASKLPKPVKSLTTKTK